MEITNLTESSVSLISLAFWLNISYEVARVIYSGIDAEITTLASMGRLPGTGSTLKQSACSSLSSRGLIRPSGVPNALLAALILWKEVHATQ